MTHAEKSVSKPPNFWKIFFPPNPAKRLVPSALAIMPPRYKKPSYGPDLSTLVPFKINRRFEMHFKLMIQKVIEQYLLQCMWYS